MTLDTLLLTIQYSRLYTIETFDRENIKWVASKGLGALIEKIVYKTK